jgi:RNA polymerase subunit RPABC4/transcription elongation factor Spt4
MALTACHECGVLISTDARRCPNCGAVDKRLKTMEKFFAVAIIIAVVMLIIGMLLTAT